MPDAATWISRDKEVRIITFFQCFWFYFTIFYFIVIEYINNIILNFQGFSNLGFVKELDEVGDEEIDSVLEGKKYSNN